MRRSALSRAYDNMKKIDINLATRKDAKDVLPWLILAAFIVFAALWSWRSINVYGSNAAAAAFYQERLARAAKEAPAKAVSSTDALAGAEDVKRLKKEAEFINNIISRETYSWTRLLTGIEKSASDNIVVTQISPNFDEKTVTVSGIARSIDGVLAMIDRMGSSGIFKSVFLLKHGENKEKKSAPDGDVILFTLSAAYSAEGEI